MSDSQDDFSLRHDTQHKRVEDRRTQKPLLLEEVRQRLEHVLSPCHALVSLSHVHELIYNILMYKSLLDDPERDSESQMQNSCEFAFAFYVEMPKC